MDTTGLHTCEEEAVSSQQGLRHSQGSLRNYYTAPSVGRHYKAIALTGKNLLLYCPKSLKQTALGCVESEANKWDSTGLAMDQQ